MFFTCAQHCTGWRPTRIRTATCALTVATGRSQALESYRCALIDDQFGYIPKRFAEAYFSDTHGDLITNISHYPLPRMAAADLGANCRFAEGALTCRLLQLGAHIQIIAVRKLNLGPSPLLCCRCCCCCCCCSCC